MKEAKGKKGKKSDVVEDKSSQPSVKFKKGTINALFKGRDGSTNPAKIDEAILSMKTYCRGRASRLLGATGQEMHKPVLLLGPSLDVFPSPLLAKVFKDGKIRYNNYSFNAFYFGDRSLLHYGCDICIDDQGISKEYAEEIKYKEIATFGQYVQIIENPIKGSTLPQNFIKVCQVEISTAGRTIIAPFRIYDLEQAHKVFNGIDDKHEDAAIRLLATIAQLTN